MNKSRPQEEEHRSKSSHNIRRLVIGVGLIVLGAAIMFFIDQTRNKITITNLGGEHFQLESVRITEMHETRIGNSVSATPGAVLANLISEPRDLPPDSILRLSYRPYGSYALDVDGQTQNAGHAHRLQSSSSWGNRISVKIGKTRSEMDERHSWLRDFVFKNRGWIPVPSSWLL